MFARRLPFRRRRSHDRDLCREGPHCATAPPPPRKRKSFVSRVWAKEVPASMTVLAVTVLLPVVTFLSAYRITDRVSQGAQWEEKGYFLSAMIDLQPAANIGSLGLTLSLGSFLVVAFVRHKIVKKQLGAQRCVLLHRASITLAFIAAIGGDGVAAYQHSASRTVHNIFAATFVLCALAHFCLECFIEWRGALSSFGVRLFHTAMCAVMAAGCATFLSHVLSSRSSAARRSGSASCSPRRRRSPPSPPSCSTCAPTSRPSATRRSTSRSRCATTSAAR